MASHALFSGLILDENDQVVETELVGNETFYVVNDNGFRRYIPSEDLDRQVLSKFTVYIQGNEDYLSEQAATMLGQEDLFTKAILKTQMKNIDQQIDQLLSTGIPDDARMYFGMMGMKIIINYRGELSSITLPSAPSEE